MNFFEDPEDLAQAESEHRLDDLLSRREDGYELEVSYHSSFKYERGE